MEAYQLSPRLLPARRVRQLTRQLRVRFNVIRSCSSSRGRRGLGEAFMRGGCEPAAGAISGILVASGSGALEPRGVCVVG
jgi:hypothetical protein